MTITFENLCFTYRNRGRKTVAIENANAMITPGTYILLGENGAGKTTLLQIIAGLRYPTSGKCLINEGNTSDRLPSLLAHTSFLGSEAIYPGRTIEEMVKLHARFYPRFDRKMLDYNLKEFGIDPKTPLKRLSFGNRHKAMVAYTLALKTEIALYDEPATGLDIESKETLRRLVTKNTDETQTVIISTHNIEDLRALYDGVIILSKSSLLVATTTEHIASRLSFKTVNELPANVLFSENFGAQFNVIVPNETGEESGVNYRMLYLALRSQNQGKIINLLKKQK